MHPFRESSRVETEARIRRFGGGPVEAPKVAKPVKRAAGGPLTAAKKTRLKLANGGAAMEGAPAKKRLDRTSRAPQVNIVIADKPDAGQGPPPMLGGPPMGPPPGLPPGGPPGLPPGGGAPPPGGPPGPGAGPPGMGGPPPGGGTMAPALAANPMLKQALAAKLAGAAGGPGMPGMKDGGGIRGQDAGAGSGEGRLEKQRAVSRQ